MKKGRIIRSLAGYYDILTDQGQVERTRARGAFRQGKEKPLVGDFVDYESEQGEGLIWAIEPRENELVRPAVANVDLAIIVTSVRQPDFSQNLLDRQLVALEAAGVRPVLYFSKLDLLSERERAAFAPIFEDYERIGYQVIQSTGAVQAIFKTVLKDQVAVVMGQTGAGKSTLLNALDPALALTTNEVSQALSRGKHTTRQVSLLALAAYQALIADTPGFSSYEVFDFPATELGLYFPEFRAHLGECQFRSCQHLNEPGCAIKEAVALGTISQARYNSYQLFYQVIQGRRPVYEKGGKKRRS
ncbi:ribosome small subunit-dependent GTPase A [Leuconostocaceae bacterium ESL0958]|nr:ribosome small subunit-dependent GTPase A [Leuconostocaceae bacterium ESL0958]